MAYNKIKQNYFYIIYDTSPLELPVAIAYTLKDLGNFFKRSPKDISSNLSRIRSGNAKTIRVDGKYYTVKKWRVINE